MAKKTTTPTEKKTEAHEGTTVTTVSEIAKKLREFRFGAAGSAGKNTSLPGHLRRQRARLMTASKNEK